MNAILKPASTEPTALERALAARTANLAKDAELTAKDQAALADIAAATQSAAALDALRHTRTVALADIQVDGATQADLPSLESQIADAEAKHRPLADAAAVAVVVRERLAAQRTALREELQAIDAELPALAHNQLRDALGVSATDFLTTRDYFFDQIVESFAYARACDLLMQRAPGSVPSASQRVSQLVIPMPQHEAFASGGEPRNLVKEIEARARELLSDLSA